MQNRSTLLFNSWDAKLNILKVFMYNVVIPTASLPPSDVEITVRWHLTRVPKTRAVTNFQRWWLRCLVYRRILPKWHARRARAVAKHRCLPLSLSLVGSTLLKLSNLIMGGVIGRGGMCLWLLQTDSDWNIEISRQEEYRSGSRQK